MDGRIQKLFHEKGFGFIKGKDNNEYFFHKSGLEIGLKFENLREGQKVEFKIESHSPRGPRANSVKLQ